jgi:hypothetical protein
VSRPLAGRTGLIALVACAAISFLVSVVAAMQLPTPPPMTAAREDAPRAPPPLPIPAPPPELDAAPLEAALVATGEAVIDVSAYLPEGARYGVVPFYAPSPLTVRETVRLTSEPGERRGVGLQQLRPGQRLRVIGRVVWPDGTDEDIWLQARADDGGEAYLPASVVVDAGAWRRRVAADRQREEEALQTANAGEGGSLPLGAPLGVITAPDAPPSDEPIDLY